MNNEKKRSCSCKKSEKGSDQVSGGDSEDRTEPISGGKTTLRANDQKKKLINRLSRIEGQVRGIKNMIENDAYCYDVLTQSAAVTSAMNSFSKEVLSAHVHGCVVREIQSGDVEVIDELMDIVQRFMK